MAIPNSFTNYSDVFQTNGPAYTPGTMASSLSALFNGQTPNEATVSSKNPIPYNSPFYASLGNKGSDSATREYVKSTQSAGIGSGGLPGNYGSYLSTSLPNRALPGGQARSARLYGNQPFNGASYQIAPSPPFFNIDRSYQEMTSNL